MRKFLLLAAFLGTSLLLIGVVIAPIIVYSLGMSWLRRKPQASDSQLGLVYLLDGPLIAATVWLLQISFNYLKSSWSNSSGLTALQSQPTHSLRPRGLCTAHDDPIVIGGGREKNLVLAL